MKKANISTGAEMQGRVTRARAAACRANGLAIPLIPQIAKPDKNQNQRKNLKRATIDENSGVPPHSAALQHKKRAVLKDVTNNCCTSKFKGGSEAAKHKLCAPQTFKLGMLTVKGCSVLKNSKSVHVETVLHDKIPEKITEEIKQTTDTWEPKDFATLVKVEGHLAVKTLESIMDGDSTCATAIFEKHSNKDYAQIVKSSKNGGLDNLDFVDIDNEHANPQMCCVYAMEIYDNLRAVEFIRRPFSNFMDTLQQDITQSMRAILIDWLVEVSEEYKLVPDTLYLTVYIIDRYLSQNYVERQKLQLLGITCMLIASKYEEICAPRVEEFCFITDNTYTKAEVLKMETQVLNFLGFQLSVPTTKTFLRRFLRAAQSTNKAPSLALGYLANYLAELALIEYNFIRFLPSAIAASAVFLARWTLDQSCHPWNPTLEHYTCYKAMDLKATVLALQELQLNSTSCPLSAIRDKYKHQKFECVATLMPPELIQSLFS